MKNTICIYSGKPIGSKDAVLIEYARPYLKKLGYIVSNKPLMMIFSLFFLLMFIPFISSTLYERFQAGDDNIGHVFGSTNWESQAFKVGNTGTNENFNLTILSVYIYRADTPGTCNISLRYQGSNGLPIGTDLTTATFDGNAVGTSAEWVNVSMPIYQLNSSSNYSIVLRCPSGTGSGDDLNWRLDTGNGYTPNTEAYSNGGSSWTASASYDMLFRVYGNLSGGCTPNLLNTSWSTPNNSSCNSTDLYWSTKYLIQYDNNSCGGSNTTFWYNVTGNCNYCSYSSVNGTLLDWYDITECVNDTKNQNSTIINYDFNNVSCCAITGLQSDCMNETTYYLQREVSCSTPLTLDEFNLDLDSKITILILAVLFIFVGILVYLSFFVFAGGLLILIGFLLLFNSFNIILSIILIFTGVLIIFLDKK